MPDAPTPLAALLNAWDKAGDAAIVPPASGVAFMVRSALADEATVEVVARVLAHLDPDEDWPTNAALGGSLTGTRDDEYRDGMRDQARAALAALGGGRS